MANLYGVQNGFGVPQYTNTIGAVNIPIPVGVETNIADSGLVIAPSNGYFYPLWTGVVLFTCGATVPNAVTFSGRIGAGSDFGSVPVTPSLFIPSSNTTVPIFIAGVWSQTAFQPPGSHVYLTIVCTGQPVTVIQSYTVPYFWLLRGPDI